MEIYTSKHRFEDSNWPYFQNLASSSPILNAVGLDTLGPEVMPTSWNWTGLMTAFTSRIGWEYYMGHHKPDHKNVINSCLIPLRYMLILSTQTRAMKKFGGYQERSFEEEWWLQLSQQQTAANICQPCEWAIWKVMGLPPMIHTDDIWGGNELSLLSPVRINKSVSKMSVVICHKVSGVACYVNTRWLEVPFFFHVMLLSPIPVLTYDD